MPRQGQGPTSPPQVKGRWDHPVQVQEVVGGLSPRQPPLLLERRGGRNTERNFKCHRPVLHLQREAPIQGLPRAGARPETRSVTKGHRLLLFLQPLPAPASSYGCSQVSPPKPFPACPLSPLTEEKKGRKEKGGAQLILLLASACSHLPSFVTKCPRPPLLPWQDHLHSHLYLPHWHLRSS